MGAALFCLLIGRGRALLSRGSRRRLRCVPLPLPPAALDALVARLRTAGCVFAEDEAALLAAEAADPGALERMTARRVAGEPLEQVVGWAEFRGLRVAVAPGVFVPRARTALLVREALGVLPAGGTVVDLCCGSGAVGLALVTERPGTRLWAADLDPAAVACARVNLGGRGEVLQGDLDAPLPGALAGQVDVLVANAPYVPTAEIAHMPTEARDHEPRTALDGGADGVDLHRRIAALAPRWLRPGGHLLIETSVRQAGTTAAACEGQGMVVRVVHDDDLDGTVVVARRRDAAS
ncbi:Release factor glutamine methyltransferase [Cellulomonas hominis]|nr:Release factor glutamine methyltransferase [Cellulomonas hominis]